MDDSAAPPPGQGSGASPIIIAPEIQEQFGPYVTLIIGSESMNDEERKYWINALPTMTQDQLKSLEEILVTEKQQLAAIDAEYASTPSINLQETEKKIMARKSKRQEKEAQAEAQEAEQESDILSQIQSL